MALVGDLERHGNDSSEEEGQIVEEEDGDVNGLAENG